MGDCEGSAAESFTEARFAVVLGHERVHYAGLELAKPDQTIADVVRRADFGQHSRRRHHAIL